MAEVKVFPTYESINAVRDVCEPWIELWGGDEWGESMRDLHGACHTSYGFTDEDCALFASRLIENLIASAPDSYEYGGGFWGYGWDDVNGRKALEQTRERAREARDEYLNPDKWPYTKYPEMYENIQETFNSMPSWLFEEQDYERLPDE